jgi:hypothetical protein
MAENENKKSKLLKDIDTINVGAGWLGSQNIRYEFPDLPFTYSNYSYQAHPLHLKKKGIAAVYTLKGQ